MKKALVFYLYGCRNAGDMAICLGLIEVLKKQNYDVTFVSRFGDAEPEYIRSCEYIHSYYPQVNVKPGIFKFDREGSVSQKLLSYMHGLCKVVNPVKDKRIKELIAKSDVVFFNGGNLLRADKWADYLRLCALFYPINMAYKAKKNIICMPQSTAQINKIGHFLLNRYLKKFDQIYIRESDSYQKISDTFPHIRFKKSTDLAFFIRDNDHAAVCFRQKYPDLINKKKSNVALILRHSGIGDIGLLPEERRRVLMKVLRRFIVDHPENAYRIVVQTEKDRAVSSAFIGMLPKETDVKLVEEHDAFLLRELYKQMQFTVSMRLHACILSLSALTPVIGIFDHAWGLKNSGILSDFAMPFVFPQNTDCVDINDLVRQLPASEMIDAKIKKYADALLNLEEDIEHEK